LAYVGKLGGVFALLLANISPSSPDRRLAHVQTFGDFSVAVAHGLRQHQMNLKTGQA